MGVLKIADFGLSKSLKMPKPKRHGLDSSNNPSSVANGHSQSNGQGQANGHGHAYKLTGETGSYR